MDLVEYSGHSGSIRHPWEQSRYAFFSGVLKPLLDSGTAIRILDIGSGDAWLANEIIAKHPRVDEVVAWDTALNDEHIARLRPRLDPRVKLSFAEPAGDFDLILLMDVLEHIEHDREFLVETVRKRLKPGGHVLITVPAWQSLYVDRDRFLKHFRRYSASSCLAVIRASGLSVVESGGLFHSLLPLRMLSKLKELVMPPKPSEFESDFKWDKGAGVTNVVVSGLRADNAISRLFSRLGIHLPGLSFWALCRK